MVINLTEDYKLMLDKGYWTLSSRRDGVSNQGKHLDIWTDTYYSKLEHVASKIAKLEAESIFDSDKNGGLEMSLLEFRATLGEVSEKLCKAINGRIADESI